MILEQAGQKSGDCSVKNKGKTIDIRIRQRNDLMKFCLVDSWHDKLKKKPYFSRYFSIYVCYHLTATCIPLERGRLSSLGPSHFNYVTITNALFCPLFVPMNVIFP